MMDLANKSQSMNDLSGRVALVTGAARGIGRAVALLLAEAGATVIVNYNERKDDALATVAEITAMNQRAIAVGADVARSGAVDTMMQQVLQHFGRVDMLVNNAAFIGIRELAAQSDEEFDRTVAINLKSAFLCMQAVLPGMRQRQWGRIVNISLSGLRAVGGEENAARAGVAELTRAYAAQLIKDGITVNAVAPSLVSAESLGMHGGDLARRMPLARLGTPLEVAQAVVMVLGNAYLTGQIIYAFGNAAPPTGPATQPSGGLPIN